MRRFSSGILYPFGHRANSIEITQRPFPEKGPGPLYLFTTKYLVVRERVKDYDDTRQLPFKSVEILTKVTPDLDPNGGNIPEVVKPAKAFWARVVGGADYMFHVKGTDTKGGETHFSMPLVFVELPTDPSQVVNLNGLPDAYRKSASDSASDRRTANLGGVPVTYGDDQGHTVLNTLSLTFDGTVNSTTATPSMASASVRIPAVTHLLGHDQPAEFSFSKNFKNPTASGNAAANKMKVFGVLGKGVNFKFGSTDQSGGFIAPTMTLQLLSHTHGPMVGPTDVSSDLSPGKYLTDDFKLLGNLKLKDILPQTELDPNPPKITADDSGATLDWTITNLSQYPGNDPVFTPTLADDRSGKLELSVQKAHKNQTKVYARLTNFTLNLFKIIQIAFDEIVFDHQPNQKMRVTARVHSVTFVEKLQFLQTLQKVIPSDGFNNPPALEVTPEGAEISYSLGLPPIAIPTNVGPMALQNVNLGANCRIPFTGDPLALGFHFATPEKPFLLTLEALGGGGYFNLGLTAAGVQSLNVALEFGGSLSIDLGVTSGALTIMGGFHFGLKDDPQHVMIQDVTAFVHASGDVNVLDLISVSAEFYMGLDYVDPHFIGTATLTVEVDVMFFHEAVDLSMSQSY